MPPEPSRLHPAQLRDDEDRRNAFAQAARDWRDLSNAYAKRDENQIAACIGRMRLSMDNLAEANMLLRGAK